MHREPRRDMPTRDRDAGFLLTETLAVFAITAFVVVGLASIAPVIMRAVDRSVSIIQDSDDLGRTFDALRRDFSGLTRARWSGLEPQGFVFQGNANNVIFAHREHDQSGAPEIRVIALKELFVDGAPQFFRTDALLHTDAASFDALRFGPRRVLPTGPARLRLWYVPLPSGNGRPSVRQSSWTSTTTLPEAIEVEAVDALTLRTIVTSHIQLHANADIGCIDTSDAKQTPSGGQEAAPTPTQTNTGNTPIPQGADPGTVASPPQGGDPNANGAAPPPAASNQSEAFCARADKAAASIQDQPPPDAGGPPAPTGGGTL